MRFSLPRLAAALVVLGAALLVGGCSSGGSSSASGSQASGTNAQTSAAVVAPISPSPSVKAADIPKATLPGCNAPLAAQHASVGAGAVDAYIVTPQHKQKLLTGNGTAALVARVKAAKAGHLAQQEMASARAALSVCGKAAATVEASYTKEIASLAALVAVLDANRVPTLKQVDAVLAAQTAVLADLKALRVPVKPVVPTLP